MGKYGLRTRQKSTFCNECQKSFAELSEFDAHYCSQKKDCKDYQSTINQRKESVNSFCFSNEKDYTDVIKKSLRTYGKRTNVRNGTHENETGSRNQICNVCQEKFSRKVDLNKHKMAFHGIKPFACDVCHKGFCTKRQSLKHLRSHDLEPFICDVCCKTFIKKRNLEIHYRLHTGEKPFLCTVCQMSFNDNALLGTHMRVHKEESNNHTCEICSRTFRFKSHMLCHMQVLHAKAKTCVCGICSKEFADLQSLEMHACHHSEQKPLLCDLCSNAFSTKTELDQHLLSHKSEGSV